MTTTHRYYYAVGRRKASTAIVKLFPHGSGKITVRAGGAVVPLQSFFGGNEYLYLKAIAPLKILGDVVLTNYDAEIVARGGGVAGIADAIKLGFSRSLILAETSWRATLKPYGFLSRDARVKERKKPGLKKARKKEKRSKR